MCILECVGNTQTSQIFKNKNLSTASWLWIDGAIEREASTQKETGGLRPR